MKQLALQDGHLKTARLLLNHRIDVTTANVMGQTALTYAQVGLSKSRRQPCGGIEDTAQNHFLEFEHRILEIESRKPRSTSFCANPSRLMNK